MWCVSTFHANAIHITAKYQGSNTTIQAKQVYTKGITTKSCKGIIAFLAKDTLNIATL
jgi:hypothetical protein